MAKHQKHHAQAAEAKGHVEKLYVVVSVTPEGQEQPQGPFEGMCLPDLLTDPNVNTDGLQKTADSINQEVRVIEYTRTKELRAFKPDPEARAKAEAEAADGEAQEIEGGGLEGVDDDGNPLPDEPTLPGVSA